MSRMIEFFVTLDRSIRDLMKTITDFRCELASGLKMYPKEAKAIGLVVTNNAIEEVKWIVRIFYESRCAFATSLVTCSKEATIAILQHLKYFVEQLRQPPLHLDPTPVIAPPIPIVSLSCALFVVCRPQSSSPFFSNYFRRKLICDNCLWKILTRHI